MGIPVQAQVGPQVLADGAVQTLRADKSGAMVMVQGHGRYFEPAYRGKCFFVANQAVATTTVGLATTYTGLCLSNPLGSGIVLALLKCTMNQSVIQATQPEAYGIAFGSSPSTNVTHTAALTPQACRVGSADVSLAKADTSATLPVAPVYGAFVQNTSTATANGPGGVIDFEGSVLLLPGAYACWVTPAQASVAGLWFSFMWEEVPA